MPDFLNQVPIPFSIQSVKLGSDPLPGIPANPGSYSITRMFNLVTPGLFPHTPVLFTWNPNEQFWESQEFCLFSNPVALGAIQSTSKTNRQYQGGTVFWEPFRSFGIHPQFFCTGLYRTTNAGTSADVCMNYATGSIGGVQSARIAAGSTFGPTTSTILIFGEAGWNDPVVDGVTPDQFINVSVTVFGNNVTSGVILDSVSIFQRWAWIPT